jgi:hypothetical protein
MAKFYTASCIPVNRLFTDFLTDLSLVRYNKDGDSGLGQHSKVKRLANILRMEKKIAAISALAEAKVLERPKEWMAPIAIRCAIVRGSVF